MNCSDKNIHYRFVKHISQDYIFFSRDIDGIMSYISPHITDYLGLIPSQIIGLKWQDAFPLTDAAISAGMEANSVNLLGKRSQPFEMELIDKSGNTLILEIHQHPFFDENGDLAGIDGLAKNITSFKQTIAEREKLIKELNQSLEEIQTLKGIIPICSYCKNIRDDKGSWSKLEKYISQHSDAEFSHGICPGCMQKLENSGEFD